MAADILSGVISCVGWMWMGNLEENSSKLFAVLMVILSLVLLFFKCIDGDADRKNSPTTKTVRVMGFTSAKYT